MMNVNVDFSPAIETVLRQQAAAAGLDVAFLIREVVTEKYAPKLEPARPGRLSHDDYKRQLDEWIQLHPVFSHEVDVSRESIYEGCGE